MTGTFSAQLANSTLDRTCEYALQHNKTLQNARDNVASSKEKVKETLAQGLPQVDGSMDFMTYFNYEMNFSFGSSGGESTIDYTKLDDGDLEVLKALGEMFGSSEPIIMDNQMSAKAQFSQLLQRSVPGWFANRKDRPETADQSLVKSELDVKENVTNSYYLILITEQTYRIIGENLTNLTTILQHTENLYKAYGRTNGRRSIENSRQLKNTQKSLERAIQLNYNMFKFQLGVAPDAAIELTDNLERLIEQINPQAALSTDFNITDNIGYQLMESQVLLSQKQVDMQNWAYQLHGRGLYGYAKNPHHGI
jgi:outer membrane protein TolC